MLAPVLLPLFMFAHALFHTGNPVAEWSVVHTSEQSCTVHLDLVGGAHDVDVAKLSLIAPSHLRGLAVSSHASAAPSDQWKRNNTWNWMWNDAVPPMTLDFELTWESCERGTTPSVDLAWEQVASAARQSWNLGSVILSDLPSPLPFDASDPTGSRQATSADNGTATVTLRVPEVQQGSFVKWSEYIPEGCTCTVLDADGSSSRQTATELIFLWFEVQASRGLNPTYSLRCPDNVNNRSLTFDGMAEVAFGTGTNTYHIAGVEWNAPPTERNEIMESPQITATQPAAAPAAPEAPTASARTQTSAGVEFAVQLLANHRDLTHDELVDFLGYTKPLHMERMDGWHKYVTDSHNSYAQARSSRNHIWATTNAQDAFVTAQLEGQRITVQEALLLTNQTWIP